MSAPARALVVEDDGAIRDLIVELLADEGYDARGAVDGAHALALLRLWLADVVLLDLNMPVLDGRAFLAARRDDDALRTVPVIVVSAQAMAADECAALGVALLIGKPFEIDALLAAVDGVLSPRRG